MIWGNTFSKYFWALVFHLMGNNNDPRVQGLKVISSLTGINQKALKCQCATQQLDTLVSNQKEMWIFKRRLFLFEKESMSGSWVVGTEDPKCALS